ncbi:phosphatidylethanolamine-binding protein 4 isoform X3 [Leucoraja erinacea]|uniref:phosphatidylethanolamine-binding protein 4 isoform X3 n=1 Tax=Leucoraja erinaceus TaxID=7782 RepID=UPI002453F875|nr:phosphatidylethanolamine-binding protein 4 isoform X3 [Leucoraja erinacea]
MLIVNRMKQLVYFLLVGLNILSHMEVDSSVDLEESICIFKNGGDSSICRGDLKVIYPELGNAACIVIPKCHNFRKLLSKKWSAPNVRFPDAMEGRELQLGEVRGTVLTAYTPPNPPSGTGYHRYQFFLYEQPVSRTISLDEHEAKSLSKSIKERSLGLGFVHFQIQSWKTCGINPIHDR